MKSVASCRQDDVISLSKVSIVWLWQCLMNPKCSSWLLLSLWKELFKMYNWKGSRLVIPAPPPISEACRHAGFSIFVGFSYNYRRVLLVVFLLLIWGWPLTRLYRWGNTYCEIFCCFFSEPAQNHGSTAEGLTFNPENVEETVKRPVISF